MQYILMILLSTTILFAVVDINSVSKEELKILKGVGVKKADKIIRYRKTHCFKSLSDVMGVKGIGPKFIEKNEAQLKVGVCKN